jgi:hypothetical protein
MDISPTTLVLLTAGVAASGTLLGVLTSSLLNMRATRMQRESEERRHHKEIVVKAAIENWKEINATAFKSGRQQFGISALDPFLVHMSALADIIFDPTTDVTNLKERLATLDPLLKIAQDSMTNPEP